MAFLTRGMPSTISASSLKLDFMYLAESLLNANVVVEQTIGSLYLTAVSLPQKQAESDTMRSG